MYIYISAVFCPAEPRRAARRFDHFGLVHSADGAGNRNVASLPQRAQPVRHEAIRGKQLTSPALSG